MRRVLNNLTLTTATEKSVPVSHMKNHQNKTNKNKSKPV